MEFNVHIFAILSTIAIIFLLIGSVSATDIDASTLQSSGFTVFATVGSTFDTKYFNETAFSNYNLHSPCLFL